MERASRVDADHAGRAHSVDGPLAPCGSNGFRKPCRSYILQAKILVSCDVEEDQPVANGTIAHPLIHDYNVPQKETGAWPSPRAA